MLLDAFVDGELTPAEGQRVERHLGGCATCRQTVLELRHLVASASSLPRQIEPARDLYPHIAERVGRHDSVTTTVPAIVSTRRAPWVGLAAAVLIFAVAGLIGLRMRDGSGPATVGETHGGEMLAVSGPDEPLSSVVGEYVDAAQLLQAAIDERSDRLSPETLEVLRKNLSIIDAAIVEVQAALEAEPSSRGKTLALRAMHEQKVELLRKFSRLSS
jgi:predicted anti-sigma-YlaC factor YlaD